MEGLDGQDCNLHLDWSTGEEPEDDGAENEHERY